MPSQRTIARVCDQCGDAFDAPLHNVLNGHGQCCSRSCAAKRRMHNRLGPMDRRFWSLVRTGERDDCWPWQGHTDDRGYGWFTHNRKHVPAHRLAYELTRGPIPSGLNACHSCDNPSCCNPGHIWPGTQKQNIDDAVAKGRMRSGDQHGLRLHPERAARGDRNGSRTHPERLPRGDRHFSATNPEKVARGTDQPNAKLTWDKVRAIRAAFDAGEASVGSLASEYGVSHSLISGIVRGKRWREA